MINRNVLILGAFGCAVLTGCSDDTSDQSQTQSQPVIQAQPLLPAQDGSTKEDEGRGTADADTLVATTPPCVSSMPVEGWVSEAGLHYQVSAVDNQIVRIRIGQAALPEDASWAVPGNARKPLACTAQVGNAKSLKSLKTAALTVTAGRDHKLSVTDSSGKALWRDGQQPMFDGNGGFSFSGVIPFGSHFYGLGDKPDSIDKSGKSYTFWNSDTWAFGSRTDPTYRTLPFYIRYTGRTYTGYFLDNTWRSTFDFGKSENGTLRMTAAGGGIDYYVIAGSSPKEVLANYAKLTGTAPLPALWSLGWQQSRYGGEGSYDTAERVENIAKGYRDRNIPADALWLDIQFQKNNYPFTVSDAFEPFDTFVKKLSDLNFKTIPIVDLHIAADASGNYTPYTDGHAKDYFVHDRNDEEYMGKVWPVNVDSVFPDFTRQPVREWWGNLLYDFYIKDGVAGIWNDMNEPSVFGPGTMPDNNIHRIEGDGFKPRNATHAEVHNVFGMQNHRATFDGMLKLKPDQRPFVMTRASYAGGQRYGVTWTGDNVSSWEHLRVATNQINGLGLAGFHAAADIGGFAAGNLTPSLLTRWIEIGSFYPISRDHTANDRPAQEPWEYDSTGTHLGYRNKYIRNRYALMPYLYTLAEETSRTGTPMMRRMFLEFPDAKAPGSFTPIDIAAETQFLVGPSLLVAPSPFEQSIPYANAIFGRVTEAETVEGASRANNHANAIGGYFADNLRDQGSQIGFTLTGVPNAVGSYDLVVRYANGHSEAKTMSVLVDGKTVQRISFPRTQNWDTWRTAYVTLNLTGGDHKMALAYNAGDSGNINIDSFAVRNFEEDRTILTTVVGEDAHTNALGWEAGAIAEPYDVMLPPGDWYDYWTGKILPVPSMGNDSSWRYRVSSPTIDVLPVFVRGGSIIPRLPNDLINSVQSTVDVAKADKLQLNVYPGEQCSGSVYTDDGNSFAYTKGNYYRRSFSCTVSDDQVTVKFGAVEGSYKPSWQKVIVSVPGSGASQTVDESAMIEPVVLSLQ